MAKRDMKAVLYLNNFWQWSGGMSTYMSWSTGKPVADPDVTGDWKPTSKLGLVLSRCEGAGSIPDRR